MGADASKLVLGIPTYGRSYTLFNPDANEIGAPADGPGDMGEATRENGYLAYYEICEYVKDQEWEVVQPNLEAMGPYAFKGNQWVGYDDEDIVRRKARYVVENGIGGIMFWAIDNDDFRGNCHGKPYPLIEAGKEAMIEAYGTTDDNLISPPSKPIKPKPKSKTRTVQKFTTPASETVSSTRRRRIKPKPSDEDKITSASAPKRRKELKTITTSTHSSLKIATPSYTTPAPPSTPDMGGAFKCEDEGFFPHPKDCKKYFWCLAGAGDNGIVAHQFTCPAGLYFNKAADSCDYTQNVLCNKKLQKAATTSSTTTTTERSTSSSTTSKPNSVFTTTRRLFRQSTTTTTEAPEEEYYEYEDEEVVEGDHKGASEEDPKVIKELIDLIRKAGGIEELEKQLKIDQNVPSSSSIDTTTQSALSKSLYERVLSKTSKNTLNALRKSSSRNSGGPQTDGLKVVDETEKRTNDKRPQYKTLTRQRASTEKIADKDPSASSTEKAAETLKPFRNFKAKNSLEYVNIRRAKSSTTTESSEDSRNKILGELGEDGEDEGNEDEVEDANKRTNVPKYVNIRRQRPSTTESSTTASKYVTIRRSTTTTAAETETDQTEKYKTVRRGTTTESGQSLDESTRKYQTISRSTTTASPDIVDRQTANADEQSNSTATTSSIEEENDVTAKYQTISRSTSTQSTTILSTESPTSVTSISAVGNNVTPSGSLNSLSVTEKNVLKIKRRPILFQPRPFSSSSTEPTTVTEATKVSQSNFKFRLRQTSPATTTTETTPTRSRTRGAQRKRVVSTTQSTPDYNQEQIRTYRPAELADLSSLTAVDLNLRGGNFVSSHRRRRPVASTTDKSNNDDQINAGSNSLSFRSTTTFRPVAEELEVRSTQEISVTPRTRKIIRRFRPSTTDSSIASSESPSTTSSNVIKLRRRIPIFRQRVNEIDLENATTTSSPLLKLFSTRPARIPNELKNDDNEHLDILNGEEGENIKLSESNIRESSPLNAFDSGEKPKKIYSGVVPQQDDSDIQASSVPRRGTFPTSKPTEPSVFARTRKIVRKLTTEPPSNTIDEKKRKLVRRLRPSNLNAVDSKTKANNGESDYKHLQRTDTIELTDEPVDFKDDTTSKTIVTDSYNRNENHKHQGDRYRIYRPSIEHKKEENAGTTTTNVPDLIDNTSAEKISDLEDQHDENFSSQALSEPSSTLSSRLSVYTRPHPTTSTTTEFYDEEEDAEEYQDEIDDDESIEPKFIKYTSSTINRSHRFESNTNFDDENEEDHDEGLTENKSITSSILKSAVNSLNQSETIINKDDEGKMKMMDDEGSPSFKQKIAISKEEIQSKVQNTVNNRPSSKTANATNTPVEISTEGDEITTELEHFSTETSTILEKGIFSTNENVIDTTYVSVSTTDADYTTDETSPAATDNLKKAEATTQAAATAEVSTADYKKKSTLKSIQERPKFNPKRITSTTEPGLHPTSNNVIKKSSYGRKTTTTTPKPARQFTIRARTGPTINRQLYRSTTTTEKPYLSGNDEYETEDEIIQDKPHSSTETKKYKPKFPKIPAEKPGYKSTTTEQSAINEDEDSEITDVADEEVKALNGRIANTPVEGKKVQLKFPKATTEKSASEIFGIDAEAVRSRNRNLFAKRKMNTPFVAITTESSVTSSESTDVTEQYSTTLQHVFAEIDDVTTTEPPSSASTTKSGKVERLIEVNRIVEVKAKEAKAKNHAGVVEEQTEVKIIPTLDKIGEITRITVIKVVDGSNETIVENSDDNEISKPSYTSTAARKLEI
ncbi:serine-rich adhesin for platelets-like, partial [Cylas formicarius]|uniref:serine-rich adhesin for platelets-like n=1 Tax=Cylas formicarius TaxID=197179 RepID=UPI002958C096